MKRETYLAYLDFLQCIHDSQLDQVLCLKETLKTIECNVEKRKLVEEVFAHLGEKFKIKVSEELKDISFIKG